jgi:hypothetical protein
MISDGIEAAKIQAENSALNSSWAADPVPSIKVRSALKRAAARLNPHLGGLRRTGRHAAPGRTFLGRSVAR